MAQGRYGLAAVSIGVALGISLLLQHYHFRVPSSLLLLFAVAISSWYRGPGPAVLAVLLSVFSFDWYFAEPVRTISICHSEIPYVIISTAFVALVSWFGTIRRRVNAESESNRPLPPCVDAVTSSDAPEEAACAITAFLDSRMHALA